MVVNQKMWYEVGKSGREWGNFYLASGLVRSYVEVKQYGYMVKVLEFQGFGVIWSLVSQVGNQWVVVVQLLCNWFGMATEKLSKGSRTYV